MNKRYDTSLPVQIDFNAGRSITVLFIFLVVCEVLFVLADAVINVGELTQLSPIQRFFNITREDGVASWFAVTQTWMLGLTAGLLYAIVGGQGASGWRRVGWGVLAVFFIYMAIDDGAEFHERIGSSVKTLLHGEEGYDDGPVAGFFPSYTWQLVFLPLFGAFGLFLLWFLNRELQTLGEKVRIVFAIGLLVLAVVADFFEGMELYDPYSLHGYIADEWDLTEYTVRHFSKSIEEFMEMLAITLLWIGFLKHLVRIAPSVMFNFGKTPSGPGASGSD